MNGEIKLVSELHKGTLVKVNIPLNIVEDDEQPANTTLLVKSFDPNIRVLVVEDNEINQEVARAVFGSINLKIDIASNGEDGVKGANENKYDLIFMDLNLPDFDGYEASERIIKLKPHQNIVALTADVFAKQNSKLVSSGIKGALYKPFDIKDLLDILNNYCPLK
jgi:CheY-like chemotaxis protein